MAKKAKNLVESFMLGALKEAKEAVDSVTGDLPQKTESSTTPSKQHHISIVSPSQQDHDEISKLPDNYQESSTKLSDNYQIKTSPNQQKRSTTRKNTKSSTNISPSPSLSKAQTRVFLWFKERGETGLFNKPEIVNDLDMPYITVRLAIKKLEQISAIELSYDNCQKNYEYKLFPPENLKLAKNINIPSVSNQHRIIIKTPSLNSSSSLNKSTTCETEYEDFDQLLKSNPELGYWRQIGLTGKKMAGWVEEFNITAADIVESLCHCRYELVDNGLEDSKPVRKPLGWFYDRLTKDGYYSKPEGYKSHHEKLIEREMERAKEIQRQADALKKAREDSIKANVDLEFEQMLNDKEGEDYQRCYEKLPDFLKKPKKQGSMAFSAAMKTAYCELKGIDIK